MEQIKKSINVSNEKHNLPTAAKTSQIRITSSNKTSPTKLHNQKKNTTIPKQTKKHTHQCIRPVDIIFTASFPGKNKRARYLVFNSLNAAGGPRAKINRPNKI